MTAWLRFFDLTSILPFGLICLAWGVGGWLIVRSWFEVRPGERLLTGAAVGFVLFPTLINFIARWTGLSAAATLSSILILGVGLGAAWRKGLHWADLRTDLRDWPQLAVLLAITLVFETAQRGVNLFDEYIHLPMISVMGTGQIPPHFYLNPDLNFAYHYILQVFAAALTGLVGFFPWSAWDLTRGLAFGFTAILSFLWIRRMTGRRLAGTLGTAALLFGGGARWLLLLLPAGMLNWVSRSIHLTNSGAATAENLVLALTRPWAIEGTGTFPFPFAYRSGIFSPQTLALGSSGALPALTVILFLLLARPFPSWRKPGVWIVLTLIFANLAISAEFFFPFLWVSIFLAGLIAGLISWRTRRPFPVDQAAGWLLILGVSALLSTVQGGFITETIRNLFLSLQGKGTATSNMYAFSLRWPPSLVSSHLGQLNPFNPPQLVALLAELGPALLAAPLACLLAWRSLRRDDWMTAGLGLSALLSLVFTLFFEYGMDTSSPRFSSTALWLWLLLALPLLWRVFQKGGAWQRAWLGSLYVILLTGGVVMFALQLTAVPEPRPSVFLDNLDLAMTRKYWNRLEPGVQVLDNYPERAVTVFGRASQAKYTLYLFTPAWLDLMKDPLPQKALAAGYSYIYMDQKWWNALSLVQQTAFQNPCVIQIAELKTPGLERFRRLLDIRRCE